MDVYRSSLFLYEVEESEDPTPTIVFWRATVFRFSRKVSKKLLRRLLIEFATTELVEPAERRVAWEKNRQVDSSASRGLGVDWIEVSRGVKKKGRVQPERRVEVVNYGYYENFRVRLGYAEFLKRAAAYGRARRKGKVVRRVFESFWKWVTSAVLGV